jgi:hypothetical protein
MGKEVTVTLLPCTYNIGASRGKYKKMVPFSNPSLKRSYIGSKKS